MNSNTNIKQGYKQTSLGILPQEWEVVRFNDIFIRIPSKKYQIQTKEYQSNGKYPVIDQGQTAVIGYSNNDNKVFKNSSVIVFGDHTRELKFVDFDFIVGADGVQLLKTKENFDNRFFYYQLKTKKIPNTGYNRHFKFLLDMSFVCPTLAEQEKIAQILGVWDKGISVLKSLIEAKTKRKKALMQRLLTPPKTSHTDFSSCHSDKVCHTEPFSCHTERSEVSKNKGVDCVDTLAFSKHQYDEVLDSCNSAPLCHTEGVAQSIQKDDLQGNAICLDSSVASLPQNDRGKLHNVKNKPNESSLRFAEFTDKWQEMRLGDICEITTGSLNANAMVENGKFAFFTCAREVYAIDNYAFDTEALLVSGNGANVGYIHYYKGKFNAYQRTYVLDKFSCNILFVKFFLDKYLKKRIAQEKNEGNTPYIVLSTLQDMKIVLPNSLAEQKKIAQVLSACDKEIELLKSKFQCLKTQKKGLMQRLLNGEVRVKC